jgi:hypothetical protein
VVVSLGLVGGALLWLGVIDWVLGVAGILIRGGIRAGFRAWEPPCRRMGTRLRTYLLRPVARRFFPRQGVQAKPTRTLSLVKRSPSRHAGTSGE